MEGQTAAFQGAATIALMAGQLPGERGIRATIFGLGESNGVNRSPAQEMSHD